MFASGSLFGRMPPGKSLKRHRAFRCKSSPRASAEASLGAVGFPLQSLAQKGGIPEDHAGWSKGLSSREQFPIPPSASFSLSYFTLGFVKPLRSQQNQTNYRRLQNPHQPAAQGVFFLVKAFFHKPGIKHTHCRKQQK